jgi:hypothetical protein
MLVPSCRKGRSWVRLRSVRPGDLVIAHMNKPAAATAEALAAA